MKNVKQKNMPENNGLRVSGQNGHIELHTALVTPDHHLHLVHAHGQALVRGQHIRHLAVAVRDRVRQERPLAAHLFYYNYSNQIRVTTISSNEKVSKYALKTFTYFSSVFLKCLNLDSFNLNSVASLLMLHQI